MLTRLLQRGFNLIEVAIIVVVVGLLIGGVIVPSLTLIIDDVYDAEEKQLQKIKTAIIGYTIRRRTLDNVKIIVGGNRMNINNVTVAVSENGINERPFVLPRDRAYLPCPDVNGDGNEDRTSHDETGYDFVLPNHPLTLDVPDNPINPLVTEGSCFATRGVIPWRTLGVLPFDHWGNVYTYQVDAIFADAIIGFNQNSPIDAFDDRSQVLSYALNDDDNNRYLKRQIVTLAVGLESSTDPGVVCGGALTLCALTLTTSMQLEAGEQASGAFTVLYRPFNARDVIEGVPFVIISHGNNGFGAVNYATNVEDQSKADPTTNAQRVTVGLLCNYPVSGGGVTVSLNIAEALNFPQPFSAHSDTFNSGCSKTDINGSFVSDHVTFTQPYGDNYDDIVVWMTREDLFDALQPSGVLSTPNFPALGAY